MKAVAIDAIGGGIAGGALALAFKQTFSVESEIARVGIATVAMLWPAYLIAILLSAKRTTDMLDASPHFDLLREAGLTETAKGKVLGGALSSVVMLCCAIAALHTMSQWPSETVLMLAGLFAFVGVRGLRALQIMGATLRIYHTAERRLMEMDYE